VRCTRTPPARRGQSLVEFALLLPVFLVLLGTAIDAGRLYFGYVQITNAAKEGALFGASKPQCTTATGAGCTNPDNIAWRVNQEAPGTTGLTIAQRCTSPVGAVRAAMTACAEGDSITVTVSQPFGLITPITRVILGPQLTVTNSSSALVNNPGRFVAPTATPGPTPAPTPTATPTGTPGPTPSPSPSPGPTCTAPTIDFTKTPSSPGFAPLSVTFTGTSNFTPTSVTWTFGDGRESTAWPFAVNTYTAKGKYDVSLTVRTGESIACATTLVKADFVHAN
jgi:Flp pilus assembly protein TadG